MNIPSQFKLETNLSQLCEDFQIPADLKKHLLAQSFSIDQIEHAICHYATEGWYKSPKGSMWGEKPDPNKETETK